MHCELVENDGPLSEACAAAIALKTCEVVARLHGGNPPLIHRDIKPQNLIVSPDGAICLVDMAAAQALDRVKARDTEVMGTALTAAPEQFGYRRCDARTDVYALGMLLVFLLTGGRSREAITSASVSGRLRRVIDKCLMFDPCRRYPSVKRLVRRLKAAARPHNRVRFRNPVDVPRRIIRRA